MTRLAEELRECDDEELDNRLDNARKELFNLRFQVATGRLDNVARIGQVRKQVACILTVLRDREITASEAVDEDGAPVVPAPRPARRARAAAAAAASEDDGTSSSVGGSPSAVATLVADAEDIELEDEQVDDAAEPAVVSETAAGAAGAAASTVEDADAEEEA
jgi:large subunit ribosomal protein L29